MQIARQVVSVWNNLEAQRAANEQIQSLSTSGTVPIKEAQETKAKLQQLETELHYLCGGAELGGITQGSLPGMPPKTDSAPAAKPVQMPTGPIVDAMAKMLPKETTELDFAEQPLESLISYMSDYHKFPFYLDKRALNEAGLNTDMPISISMKKTPLAAALQALEDQNQGLRFVVRDYGILLTTIDQARAQGYYPVLEFAKTIEKGKSPGDLAPVVVPGPQTYTPREEGPGLTPVPIR